MNELAKQFDKYREKKPSQLIKLLFHGSGRGGEPKLIYESEDGLDIRFARAGMYGVGIYFADNSGYSHSFAFRHPDGTYSMFLCYVLPGHSAYDPPNPTTLRIPPLLHPGTERADRFDTVMNRDRDHTITYSNAKSYPAYLINYRP
mmetsp:Transcript_894/g.1219  ORF Transcript_894/g.1219 Transcript_894/m.1219 type:complete len:146 (-) Transcript_894:106-543(-)|eukprot:CAMPEP_0185618716 /NCGR_PEP_ID=MMETSP0436-20130131/47989_1 /TAXON_ID=626734 ORGANISM="Favella taraikaensis, Strain Fe Narragansett Bay" /NCGR_SAMPLE_ID=MMETSP0436 /ASSEMBLY_ACC=CAM_ASM_000390 /LENGTH=145 /DNA_ID=CAMNT_0028257565 /DNA_START=604 /DNA_END=1041 /DNA_ORIENTATION=-